ncbi:MAG: hypothetical protein JSR82_17625 [Verrucomicrobia bacterium]|nr:hypothetical protein [Verrucomicrobiota bacterium]
MTAIPPTTHARGEGWFLTGSLALYFVLAALLAASQMDRLNPDGVAYLRQAGYWAEGVWSGAVSLYWSPLFPLTMAPLRWAGVDGLVAARLALALHGAFLLWATSRLLRTWSPAPPSIHGLLLLALAPAAASLQMFVVAPDVLVAAVLIWSFAMLPAAARADTPRNAFWVGAIAGLAVWAKAYALPFGLLHLPASIWWLRRSAGARSGPWVLSAVAGLLLAVLPLWCLLGWKNGGPTIGKSGPINHAVVGPSDKVRFHPVVWGVPSPPYVSVWEAPDRLPYQFWSPFSSETYFRHQLNVVARNTYGIGRALLRLDFGGLGLSALLALAVVAGRGPRWAAAIPRSAALWLTGTWLLYAGGYLPVAFEPRYLNALALPLILLAVAWWTQVLPRRWALVMPAVLGLSLLLRWGPLLLRDYQSLPADYFRGIVGELQKAGLRGPFAATSWYHGIALAYHTGEVHAGFPPEAEVDAVAERLRAAKVNWIVVFDYPVQPPLPVQDLYPPTRPRAIALVTQEGWKVRVDLRVRPDPASPLEVRVLAFERPGEAQ